MHKPHESISEALADHPVVENIYKQGYIVYYQWDNMSLSSEHSHKILILYAFKDKRQVAYASTSRLDDASNFSFEEIWVYGEPKRQGIANALAVCAIEITKLPKVSAPGLLSDGLAWTNQPNRPW